MDNFVTILGIKRTITNTLLFCHSSLTNKMFTVVTDYDITYVVKTTHQKALDKLPRFNNIEEARDHLTKLQLNQTKI